MFAPDHSESANREGPTDSTNPSKAVNENAPTDAGMRELVKCMVDSLTLFPGPSSKYWRSFPPPSDVQLLRECVLGIALPSDSDVQAALKVLEGLSPSLERFMRRVLVDGLAQLREQAIARQGDSPISTASLPARLSSSGLVERGSPTAADEPAHECSPLPSPPLPDGKSPRGP